MWFDFPLFLAQRSYSKSSFLTWGAGGNSFGSFNVCWEGAWCGWRNQLSCLLLWHESPNSRKPHASCWLAPTASGYTCGHPVAGSRSQAGGVASSRIYHPYYQVGEDSSHLHCHFTLFPQCYLVSMHHHHYPWPYASVSNISLSLWRQKSQSFLIHGRSSLEVLC